MSCFEALKLEGTIELTFMCSPHANGSWGDGSKEPVTKPVLFFPSCFHMIKYSSQEHEHGHILGSFIDDDKS